MNNPKVTVFMPVYNGERYIKEAIESVLSQTFKDFELLIVNDGSTDSSLRIINSFTDERIRVINNEKNLGIPATRNIGFINSKGEYFATLDCDDVSYPERLEKQVKFLDRNKDFGAIGSFLETIDENGKIIKKYKNWLFPASPEEIPCILLFSNYLANSATMIRKEAIPKNGYRLDLPVAEDYGLWVEITKKWKVWNLQEILLKHRNHGKNTSIKHTEKYSVAMPKIFSSQLDYLGVNFSSKELNLHYSFSVGKYILNDEFLIQIEKWFSKLQQSNTISKKYDKIIFSKTLIGRWLLLCKQSDDKWWQKGKIFWKSELLKASKYSAKEIFQLASIYLKYFFRKLKNTTK